MGLSQGRERRQQQRQNVHACAGLLHLLVVLADPAADRLTLVPGGIISDQEPVLLATLEQALTTPLQELGGEGAHRTSSHEAQPDLRTLRRSRNALLPQRAITSQRLGIGVVFAPALLHQAAQRAAHAFVGDGGRDDALFQAQLGCQLQGPHTTILAQVAWTAMQEVFQDRWGAFPACRAPQNLAATHDKRIRRTQSRLDLTLFVLGQRSDKNGSSHTWYCATFPITFRGYALVGQLPSPVRL